MNIAFVTTQEVTGSTVMGRILPLANELSKRHAVHVLVHAAVDRPTTSVSIHEFGKDPFTRTSGGKKRLRGIPLIFRMKLNAWHAFFILWKLRPDIVVISKALPENTLAAWLYSLLRSPQFILDADDFELAANTLSSSIQRVVVHTSERIGAHLASTIVVASPFLEDRFRQLTPKKRIVFIPTGISAYTYPKPTSDPVMLYIGSVSIASGHRIDMLPDILQNVRTRIPNATLHIAGSGDEVETLKTAFTDKGLTDAVTWSGQFRPADIPSIVAKARLLIDPIDGNVTNRAKSSSRVLIALAAGLPVITSNIGVRTLIIPQMFHEAFFALPADVASYTDKIVQQLQTSFTEKDNSCLTEATGRYLWNTLAHTYEQIWKS